MESQLIHCWKGNKIVWHVKCYTTDSQNNIILYLLFILFWHYQIVFILLSSHLLFGLYNCTSSYGLFVYFLFMLYIPMISFINSMICCSCIFLKTPFLFYCVLIWVKSVKLYPTLEIISWSLFPFCFNCVYLQIVIAYTKQSITQGCKISLICIFIPRIFFYNT